MKNRFFLFFMIAVVLGLIWYLFIKPYDYKATFTTKATAGTLKQSLKLWAMRLDSSEIIPQQELNRFTHMVRANDSLFEYDWSIGIMDSVSKVVVHITDTSNSLMHRLGMPFSTTDFEKRSERTILDFYVELEEHLANFKVSVVGLDSLPPTYCAYIPFQGQQAEKARKMMQSYPMLDGFVFGKDIKTNGRPFIEVEHWAYPRDSIAYNFCYPILKSDSLPKHPKIRYKQFMGSRGIKAIYNGNYITSDRAWYHLLDYARKNGIDVLPTPIEVFHNNPNFSSNHLEWVTEVYMPIYH
ncbi:MAG: AraC family transcriptional regulator [Bacteroidota bacterium]